VSVDDGEVFCVLYELFDSRLVSGGGGTGDDDDDDVSRAMSDA